VYYSKSPASFHQAGDEMMFLRGWPCAAAVPRCFVGFERASSETLWGATHALSKKFPDYLKNLTWIAKLMNSDEMSYKQFKRAAASKTAILDISAKYPFFLAYVMRSVIDGAACGSTTVCTLCAYHLQCRSCPWAQKCRT
jgi:hypothetical protein